MSNVTKITDFLAQAKSRLLEQYKNKPNIENVLSIYSEQFDALETAFFQIDVARFVPTAIGVQLDQIGEIVGQPRNGITDDDRYRVLIYARIGINISEGEIERIIDVFKLITESEYVHLINLDHAHIQLLSTDIGQFADQDAVNFIYSVMQQVVAAGVRIDHILCADETEAFAYAGTNANAPGLGYSNAAQTTGGKYATEHVRRPEFAYAGSNPTFDGYGGGPLDPLAGGVYVA